MMGNPIFAASLLCIAVGCVGLCALVVSVHRYSRLLEMYLACLNHSYRNPQIPLRNALIEALSAETSNAERAADACLLVISKQMERMAPNGYF